MLWSNYDYSRLLIFIQSRCFSIRVLLLHSAFLSHCCTHSLAKKMSDEWEADHARIAAFFNELELGHDDPSDLELVRHGSCQKKIRHPTPPFFFLFFFRFYFVPPPPLFFFVDKYPRLPFIYISTHTV